MKIPAFSAAWSIADSAECWKGTAGVIWKDIIIIHPCTVQEIAEAKLFSIFVQHTNRHLWLNKDRKTTFSFAYKE